MRHNTAKLLLVSLTGWLAVLGSEHQLILPGICIAATGSWVTQGLNGIAAAYTITPPTELIQPWLVMLLAMMPPLLTQQMTHLCDQSPARRRLRAVALFVVGYGAVWIVVGIALVTLVIAIRTATDAALLPAVVPVVAVALLWQSTPAKQGCVIRCHDLPRLSASGIAADRDCLRYGVTAGVWCIGACWALMLIPLAVDGMHILIMAVVSALSFVERLVPARPPRWRFVVDKDLFTIHHKTQGGAT